MDFNTSLALSTAFDLGETTSIPTRSRPLSPTLDKSRIASSYKFLVIVRHSDPIPTSNTLNGRPLLPSLLYFALDASNRASRKVNFTRSS
eukprot:10107638-Ditylum_brightwellii.AAC.2